MTEPMKYPTESCVTDVPHAELYDRVRQWSLQGWQVTHAIPSYETIQTDTEGNVYRSAVLWTVFVRLVPF
jgi:hypothetical protein